MFRPSFALGFTSNQVTINVAGTYTLAATYSGELQLRETSELLKLDFKSLTFSGNTGLYRGSYAVSRSGVIIDTGNFDLESTPSLFILRGTSRSGDQLLGAMDTLDAGQSFLGIFIRNFQDA